MRKAYVVIAILTGLGIWLLMIMLLLPWWVATLLTVIVALIFWREAAPFIRYWQPENRHSGWQRNALRFKRRSKIDD